MNELPKELTVKLLSLVLGIKVIDIRHDTGDSSIVVKFIGERIYRNFSIDTLIRLMKEFILKHFMIVGSYYSTSVRGWCVWVEDFGNKGIAKTEFESVLKATYWVMKEKGLFDE